MSENKLSPTFTIDMCITDALHQNFQMQCRDELFRKKEQGRGFFLDADTESLQQRLEYHIQEGNYVAASNYCMMLHQKKQLNAESNEFYKNS